MAIDGDGISCEVTSLRFVGDVLQHILHKVTQIVKLDLKQAYHHIPVHPQDQHFLGTELTYGGHALPFDLRSALNIYSGVANMLEVTH